MKAAAAAAAEAKEQLLPCQVQAAQHADAPLASCDLPRMVRISKPKCFWKTFLAFWRFRSLSLFALFWAWITEKEKEEGLSTR